MYAAITVNGQYVIGHQCPNCGLITEYLIDPNAGPPGRQRFIDEVLDTTRRPPSPASTLYVPTENTAVRRAWETSA